MSKELVLFICHVINDESMFRFKEIQNGAKANGFDCKFALDISNGISDSLKNTTDLELFTFKNDKNDLFFQKNCFYNILQRSEHTNNWQYSLHVKILLDALATNIFNEYSKIWLIEYDCCYFGHWSDFFKKHKDVDVDFHAISNKISEFSKTSGWSHAPSKTYDALAVDNIEFRCCLICCSRFSENAVKAIKNFYKKYGSNNDLFYEFVFPSACINANLKYKNDIMPNFRWAPSYDATKDQLAKDTLIHPMKLNCKYSDLLKRYGEQS